MFLFIKCDEDTWEKIQTLKIEKRLKTYNDVLKFLLSNYCKEEKKQRKKISNV